MTDPAIHFRKTFRSDRIRFIREHGATAFDQARALYVCRKTGEQVVFSDAFYGAQTEGEFAEFLDRLVTGWWAQRQAFKTRQDDLDLHLVAGVYSHFLAEVGYDYTIEFEHDGPVRCWRVDAAGRANKLAVPEHDGMFHGQTGTFFDLRAGWRSLLRTFEKEKRLVVAEVQPGYFIGVRPGVPGEQDPASRHDPDLEFAFSQRVDYGFDTIEFLESKEARLYPIESQRYTEWLADWSGPIQRGEYEPFILANSERFSAAIDELCELRQIDPQFEANHERLSVRLTKGAIQLELDLGDLFLRCLHTGQTFEKAARSLVVPSLDLVDDAYSLLLQMTERLQQYEIKVESGSVVCIFDGENEVGRWSLFDVTGRGQSHGTNALDGVLRLMGFDPESGMYSSTSRDLGTCPVCGAPARVEKVIRPTTALGVDAKTLVGVPIGEHTVYFTLDCPLHSTPLQPQPDMTLADYESAYQDGLDRATTTLVHQQTLPDDIPGQLLIGHGAGSLVLEPGRIRTLLSAVGEESTDQREVYGFFPDALVVTERPLTDRERQKVRTLSRELVETAFPNRAWSLGITRSVSLDTPALGHVDFLPT